MWSAQAKLAPFLGGSGSFRSLAATEGAGPCQSQGTHLIICEVERQPRHAIIRAKKLEKFGRHNFVASLYEALDRANELLDGGEPSAK